MSDTTKEAMVLIGELHAAKESLRWETAMRDVAANLDEQMHSLQCVSSTMPIDDPSKATVVSVSLTYAHAAETLRAAIAAMKETP